MDRTWINFDGHEEITLFVLNDERTLPLLGALAPEARSWEVIRSRRG